MKLSKRSFSHSLAIWWHLRVLKLPLMISFSIHFHNTNNVIKSKLSEICLQAESLPSRPTSLNTQAPEASGQRAGPLAAVESACRRLNGALHPHLPHLWKPFSICTVKASFLPSLNWPHQKQKPRNENDYTLRPTLSFKMHSLSSLTTQAEKATRGSHMTRVHVSEKSQCSEM